MSADGLVDELREVLGADRVLVDPELTASYFRDWTGRYEHRARAVVRPRTTDEVAETLACCHAARVSVVPQGGNTGLVGGSVPRAEEIVLSLRALDSIGPVDSSAGQITAGAGVTLAALQEVARAAGWEYGVDLSARDSATVGGTVATNAGGLHVIRYGDTRAQLVGYEAVLADGTVLSHLGGLLKDNTGYALGALFCGSEGTLAVLTAARLRLVPPILSRTTAMVEFASIGDAIAAVGSLRRQIDSLLALEIMTRAGLELVAATFGISPPAPIAAASEALLIVEAGGASDPSDRIGVVLDAVPGARAVAVAASARERAAIWAVRDRHTEAVSHAEPPVKLDVSVPHSELAAFSAAVEDLVARIAPGARLVLFGHAGDGNLHVNVVGHDPAHERRIVTEVLNLVSEHHGSISAEHGIGIDKRDFLGLSRSPAEIDTFRRLKSALDPHNILNPGVLLDSHGR